MEVSSPIAEASMPVKARKRRLRDPCSSEDSIDFSAILPTASFVQQRLLSLQDPPIIEPSSGNAAGRELPNLRASTLSRAAWILCHRVRPGAISPVPYPRQQRWQCLRPRPRSWRGCITASPETRSRRLRAPLRRRTARPGPRRSPATRRRALRASTRRGARPLR